MPGSVGENQQRRLAHNSKELVKPEYGPPTAIIHKNEPGLYSYSQNQKQFLLIDFQL